MPLPRLPLVLLLPALALGCGRTRPTDIDGDGWLSSNDCNDRDPGISPGQPEIPFDGLNNDCNTSTLDNDGDQDGVVPPIDCDDTDPSIPAAEETYYDGIDNDCDARTSDDDQDDDGVPVDLDCNDEESNESPENTEVPYDGFDNDCDPETLDSDLDGDGVGPPQDCDDEDPTVQAVTQWFVDCDGDGFAPEGAASVYACQMPLPSETCAPTDLGLWTSIQPLDADSADDNETTDCGDREPLAFPGQTGWFAEGGFDMPAGRTFDMDCNGQIERELFGFQCFFAGPGQCSTAAGLVFPTDCGNTGDYATDCVGDTPCEPAGITQALQRCR
jgi:hypothetical protein